MSTSLASVPLLEYGGATLPAPKFWTPRDPSRPSLGPIQSAFGRIWLGAGFMPWQQLVADVAGELLPDGSPAYPFVVVTLQRQGGKSHLSLASTAERCFARAQFRAWYTAQTGGDSRDQFLKFHDEQVVGHPLERVVRTLKGNGHELMRFPNQSTIRPHPPTETALHGKQSDRNDIDEAWAFDEDEGNALMQAIGPTQLTRPSAQTFIWSAGGTAASTWLARLVARGREGDPSVCYFEWGIPDDLALDDLEAIAHYHPAFGHTVNLAAIKNLRALLPDDSEFSRAAGNRWTEIIGGAIKADWWEAVRTDRTAPDDAPVGYGAARSADGSQVVVAAAARDEVDGVVVVEILEVLSPGRDTPGKVAAWADAVLAADPTGPSAPLVDKLRGERVELLELSGTDVTSACANVIDDLRPLPGQPAARMIRYRPHPDLDASAKVVATRAVADGGFRYSRTASVSPIAAIEAATYAVWALDHRPPPKPAPMTAFG